MDLHELRETIVKVREIISQHEAILLSSLANTRQAVIVPILQQLGWNTANLDEYVADYQPGQELTICALTGKKRGTPTALMVTKRLGQPTGAYEMNRVATIARDSGIPYVGTTNGAQWKLERGNNPILEADITKGEPAAVATKLAQLWKDAISTTDTAPPPSPQHRKTMAAMTGEETLPATMTFPDAHEHQVTRWRHYAIGVAQWLHDTGKLDVDNLAQQPGTIKKGTLLVPTPEQELDKNFKTRHVKIRGKVWSYINYDRQNQIKATQRNLAAHGVDPAQITITFHE